VNVLFSRPEEIEEVQAHIFTDSADAQEDKLVADALFRSDSLDDPPERGKVFDGVLGFVLVHPLRLEILGQLDYEEEEVKPYKPNELKALFQAADDEEQLWMKTAEGWTANTEQRAWPSKTSTFIHCVAMCNENFAATLLQDRS
jgi:hypothetical protein